MLLAFAFASLSKPASFLVMLKNDVVNTHMQALDYSYLCAAYIMPFSHSATLDLQDLPFHTALLTINKYLVS